MLSCSARTTDCLYFVVIFVMLSGGSDRIRHSSENGGLFILFSGGCVGERLIKRNGAPRHTPQANQTLGSVKPPQSA